MTWRELMKFISEQDPKTLDEEVKVYVHSDKTEHKADLTEVLEDGWIPFIAINEED